MQGHTKAAIVIFILGFAGIVAWRFVEPLITDSVQTEISDAADLKATITIAIDGWVGYFPLCSPEMKKRLRRESFGLKCIDDAADYDQRFKKLDDEQIDFAVATVDSYIVAGAKQRFPGAIIAVIDESKGGDAIVARRSVVDSLEALKNHQSLKVAFTPSSPSHHLMRSVASHFDVEVFKNSALHIHSDGSENAYKKLLNGDSDVAILWEPDVSRALNNNDFVRLLGTEDTKQLIVDILIASRKVAAEESEKITALLKSYFKTLKYYQDNPETLIDDIATEVDLPKKDVATLLDGVAWTGLNDNAETWFAASNERVSPEALINTIESTVDILLDLGDFSKNPLPNQDPYRIVSSQHIAALYAQIGAAGSWNAAKSVQDPRKTFPAITSTQWGRLEEVGSLKARKISFASGTSELTDIGRQKIDELVKDLQHYPTFRVEVRGHTATRGDAEVNIALSQERADAVLDYMMKHHNVEANRVRAVGFGGLRPLVKKPNESDRSYRYRLPRVELVLVRERI